MKILTLSLLISNKAFSEGRSHSSIIEEVAAGMNTGIDTVKRMRRAEENIRVSLDGLLFLSDYFGVSIDDLINSAYREQKLNAPAKV